MANEKPVFDPNKPYTVASKTSTAKPPFDPNKPFDVPGATDVSKTGVDPYRIDVKPPEAVIVPTVTEDQKIQAAAALLKGAQQDPTPIDEVERKNIQSTWGIPGTPLQENTSLAAKATDVIGRYIENTAMATEEGVKQAATGFSEAMGTPDKAPELTKGLLNATAGTVKAAFGVGSLVVPQLIVFNTAIETAKALPKEVKTVLMTPLHVPGKTDEQYAETFDKIIDLPFTAASSLANVLGYNPEDGSSGKAALEILDLAGILLVGAKAGKDVKIKDSKGLLSSIEKMKEAKEPDIEMQDYIEFSDKLQGLKVEDIKQAAIEKGTPEAIDIALKIDDLAPKPVTAESVKEQYRAQSDLQSKQAYDAIKQGPEAVEVLKNTIDNSAAIGDITPVEHEKAIFKINAYEKYASETRDLGLDEISDRRVHDLSWSNENLKLQSDKLHELPDAKIPGSITHIRLAATENLLRENSKEMGDLMDKKIMDQQSAVSLKSEEKVKTALKKKEEAKPKAVDINQPYGPEEGAWIAENIAKVKEKLPEGNFEDHFQEARKQYKELKASGKLEEAKPGTETVAATEVKAEEVKPVDAKEGTQVFPKQEELKKNKSKVEKPKSEEPVKPVEVKLEPETEKYVNDQIEELRKSEDADFNESLLPVYKEHFKIKYDEQKTNTARAESESSAKDSEVLTEPKAKRIVAGTSKAKRKLSEKATKALKVEANSPYDRVLQYFVNKGNLHPSAIKELYGEKSAGESRARIGLLSKSGKTLTEIAHDLWENRPEGDERFTDQDYRNAVEQVINEHKSSSSMADELLRKGEVTHELTKEESDYYDTQIAPEFIDEALDYWDKLTDAEKESLAFEAEAKVEPVNESKAIADRLRKGKISGAMSTIDFGISKTIINTALELAAKEVEKGSKIGVAIEKAVKWIDQQMAGKKWNKKEFIKYATDKQESKDITPKSPDEYKRNFEKSKEKESKIKTEIKEAKNSINEWASTVFAPVSTVLNDIHPVFKRAVRDYQLNFERAITKDVDQVKGYLEAKQKMLKENKEDWHNYDLALKNNDVEMIRALSEKYGMEKQDATRKVVFDEIFKDSKDVGIDLGFKEDYHPRVVEDVEGLMDYISKEAPDDANLIKSLIEVKEAYLERSMTIEEKGEFVSSLLLKKEGSTSLAGIGNFKIRSIDHVTPEINKFYFDSDTAMLHYITGAREAIARRKLFGKAGAEAGTLTFGESLGLEAWKLLEKGEIDTKQFQKVQDVITAYFNKKQPYRITTILKNITYIDLLASFKAAFKNLTDLGISAKEAGLYSSIKGAAKALVNKSDIKMNEVLADDVIHDFDNNIKIHGVMGTLFKASAFKHFDQMGKETLINSIMDKLKSQAKGFDKMRPSEKVRFNKYISDWVEPAKVESVIADLKKGKLTDETLRLVYNRMLDLAPVGKSEMSELYLKNPQTRFLYALKSYTLKRFDVYRNDIIKKIKSSDPEIKREGMKELIKSAIYLTMFQAGVEEISDWMSGKEKVTLSDRVYYSMLQLVGSGPFLGSKFEREGASGVAKSLLEPTVITAPFKILDDVYDDLFGKKKGRTVSHIPIFGKLVYDWNK